MKGDIKAGKSSIVGAAGEYFVMAELLRQGWIAGLTPRGAPDFDILATKGERTIQIRVKTKTADSNLFRWNRRKDGNVFRAPIGENDFCVLADIGRTPPEYYIIPTARVEKGLQQFFTKWLEGKSTRNADNPIIAFKLGRDDHDKWLLPFRDNWKALG